MDAESNICPPRPASSDPEDLRFTPKPMVRWLDPLQLLETGTRVVLSGIFGAYSDQRMLQALMAGEVYDRSGPDELWVDYVADLGDGWDPTYTIATLLASAKLELDDGVESRVTERGDLLIMGGDQVYPLPKRADYENRFLGPYRAAHPCSPGEPPELFAIPGSHDWYDGLVNFMSVFCRRYWVGGWKTRQTRSYFAIKLPQRWWLWAVDIQFGDYIDDAQLRYFREMADRHLERGDRIVLCTARAPGATELTRHLYAERNLEYFEREIVRPAGASVLLHVASGHHYYARYKEKDGPRQHISSGGGGAFLHPTHILPESREMGEGGGLGHYERMATYPEAADSKRLLRGLWLLPLRNRAFAGLVGGVHVLLALMLGLHSGDAHVSLSPHDLWRALLGSPTAVVVILGIVMIVGGMVRLARDAPLSRAYLVGFAHSGLQLLAAGGLMVGASRAVGGLGLDGALRAIAFLVVLGVFGAVVGSLGLASYLWTAMRLGFHGNEAYAPLRVMDFKHFLRLHIARDGSLTVFPIGVDRVCRRWRVCTEGPLHAPWFEPDGAGLVPRLVERPFRVGD